MDTQPASDRQTVATRLRPIVLIYAALNVAVAALLLSTVSPTLPVAANQEIASIR
ncbi:hypothetical protein LXM94_12305 [Rhizobium sp. TRM95111]|uniref:hypothetical protein n=1 Tax=Rhizobium alarense TaxID=2846851 RepID=UPI001F1DA8E7|nr:hypothetical protein [Rhizobium alarense]MCF3640749.1 hypothetical protein [Rhizobium alarense]